MRGGSQSLDGRRSLEWTLRGVCLVVSVGLLCRGLGCLALEKERI